MVSGFKVLDRVTREHLQTRGCGLRMSRQCQRFLFTIDSDEDSIWFPSEMSGLSGHLVRSCQIEVGICIRPLHPHGCSVITSEEAEIIITRPVVSLLMPILTGKNMKLEGRLGHSPPIISTSYRHHGTTDGPIKV